jgi:enoyl-[acyl-carrier-protein] reductase (NADH)
MTDEGGSLAITFYGAEKAIEEYNLMWPVTSPLERRVRRPPERARLADLNAGSSVSRMSVAAFLIGDRTLRSTGLSCQCWLSFRLVNSE